jgi:hypothetical protein
MCDAAGLPKKTRPSGEVVRLCTPHGLRKRCLTDLAERGATAHEIMSVSGHLTLKELERYTRMADRNAKADAQGWEEQEGNERDRESVKPRGLSLSNPLLSHWSI